MIVTRSTAIVAACTLLMSWMDMSRIARAADDPPKVGDAAKDFALPSLSGETVRLSELTMKGPVVLVVLRGFPGYQCPICNQQVGQFLQHADKFEKAGAQLVFVYPGAGKEKDLTLRANEFVKDRRLPAHVQLLTDPDYKLTNAYHLRWDAPRETAYPSTFVIRDGKIAFAKISRTHGGRATPEEVLTDLNAPR